VTHVYFVPKLDKLFSCFSCREVKSRGHSGVKYLSELLRWRRHPRGRRTSK